MTERWDEATLASFERHVLHTLEDNAEHLPDWALRAWPGLHWCAEFDGLLVHRAMPEWDLCLCDPDLDYALAQLSTARSVVMLTTSANNEGAAFHSLRDSEDHQVLQRVMAELLRSWDEIF